MKKTLNDFFTKSASQLKKMRKAIQEIKKEQKAFYEIERKQQYKVSKKEEILIHFSMVSVAKATLVVISLLIFTGFLGQILDIIVVLFVSVLFSAALDPSVDTLERYKIPRSLSVLCIFAILLGILGFFISQMIPLLASQLIELAKSVGDIINNITQGKSNFIFAENIQNFFNESIGSKNTDEILQELSQNLETLGTQLQSIAGDTFEVIKNLFNGIVNFFLVLILTFFLVVDEKSVNEFFISLFPSKHGEYIIEKSEAIKKKVGLWLRGQVILMVMMFLISLIAYGILNLDFALTLAMLAGIAELIPVMGVFLAAIPALLVAFNQSPWLMLWTAIAIIVIQQLEGNLLVPLVMKKAVGLNPIIVILAMLIGFKILGILGAIIAVPVATTLSIFVLDYSLKAK